MPRQILFSSANRAKDGSVVGLRQDEQDAARAGSIVAIITGGTIYVVKCDSNKAQARPPDIETLREIAHALTHH